MNSSVIVKLTDLSLHLEDDIDLFICSASFEDRSFKIAESIKRNVNHVLVFMNEIEKNETNKELKIKNANYLKSLFTHLELVTISKSNPFFTSNQLIKNIFQNRKISITPKKIVIDITTFTHETLLILYKVINVFKAKGDSITLLYNPADDYCFKTVSNDEKWLSKGIKEIRTILGFPGYFSPYKKLHLIILVGYETEKCIQLIEKYEPSVLSFGMPSQRDSVNEKIHKINFSRFRKLLSIYSNVNEFNFSCIDPEATKKAIVKLIKQHEDYNTVIAPMNNKMSTIGVGLAAMEIKKTQVCYAKANLYNTEDYSLPSDRCIIYRY